MSGLNAQVLVLDKNFQPLKILNGKDAVVLLFTEKAYVLDASYCKYSLEEWIDYSTNVSSADLPIIKSPKFNLVVPEIMILPNYLRKQTHNRKMKYSRSAVFKRDRNVCQYCAKSFKKNELTVDHIVPRSQGGRSTWMNITTACKSCNSKKANRTPEEAEMKLLSQPKVPTWKDTLDLEDLKNSWTNFI